MRRDLLQNWPGGDAEQCWFCNARWALPATFLRIKLHMDADRSCTADIARCSECAAVHARINRLKWAVGTMGLLAAGALAYGLWTSGVGIGVALGVALVAQLAVEGGYAVLIAPKLLGEGRKRASDALDYGVGRATRDESMRLERRFARHQQSDKPHSPASPPPEKAQPDAPQG